ncbi:hypothetical protein [Ferrovibrio sp.]|uniref:hypothetical protein n=1 Tax=Ferrovibrio sp. TaxID=1917215 RepID=UPI001B7BA8C4|nr:hypothetical protein [Ferrovibrio sp.]MBP7063453.1 hypothetical protein [Ferrovibrio sp.]
MRFPKTAALAVAFLTALAACTTPPPPRLNLPEIGFAQSGPLIFAAGSVETVNEFRSSFASPYIEHMLPQPPARVAERWARDRVQLDNSQPNSVRVVIKDASVIEQDIAKTPGLRGQFTNDQVSRFEVSLGLVVEVRDARGFKLGEASASAKRSGTLAEKATLNDRDMLIYNLIKDASADVDRGLDQSIRQYLPLYVR